MPLNILVLACLACIVNGRRVQASANQTALRSHKLAELKQLQSDGRIATPIALRALALLLLESSDALAGWQATGFVNALARSNPTGTRAGSRTAMMARSRSKSGRDKQKAEQFRWPFAAQKEEERPGFVWPFASKKKEPQPGFKWPFGGKEEVVEHNPIADFFNASVTKVTDAWSELRPLQVFSGFMLAISLFVGGGVATGNVVNTFLADEGNSKIIERTLQFGTIFENIKGAYVDMNIDLDALFEKGVNAMLGTLDPYSTYENAQDSEDLVMRVSGKYAGVGITVGKNDDEVLVVSAFEGYAYNAGVRAGDRIISIDGKPVSKLSTDAVKNLLRGDIGTTVNLIVERDGSPEPTIAIPIRRQIVRLPDVTLATVDRNGVGYIKLEGFSEGTAEETERAISLMQSERELKGLVIDMRDNPGGVLDAAISVSQQLVPEGTEIVSTSGRQYGDGTQISYRSSRPPLLSPRTRVVVLVNSNTASAAEIVTGVVQDTDRGVVVGERTYGKGLVQVVEPLPGGGLLKLTVAKYYTPSGRCIQAVSYAGGRVEPKELAKAAAGYAAKDSEASNSAGSVKDMDPREPSRPFAASKGGEVEYLTKAGRAVKAGGGIAPDVNVEPRQLGELERSLLQRGIFYDFASQWLQKHPAPADDLATRITKSQDEMWREFVSYVRSKATPTPQKGDKTQTSLEPTQVERQLDAMQKYLDSSGGTRTASLKELAVLRQKLLDEELDEFRTRKTEIQQDMNEALLGRLTSPSSRLAARLATDPQVLQARRIAADATEYARLLEPDNAKSTMQAQLPQMEKPPSIGELSLFPSREFPSL